MYSIDFITEKRSIRVSVKLLFYNFNLFYIRIYIYVYSIKISQMRSVRARYTRTFKNKS